MVELSIYEMSIHKHGSYLITTHIAHSDLVWQAAVLLTNGNLSVGMCRARLFDKWQSNLSM